MASIKAMTKPQPMRRNADMPKAPEGWPVGSFTDYADAQRAVDYLADRADFPVEDVTIVGVNLMQVEKVVGRLTWGRVLWGGAFSGAWLGLFFGLLMSLFVTENWWVPIVVAVVFGIVFGVISAAVGYAASKGARDFASTTQIVAARYDVLCQPKSAERARDLISELTKQPRRADRA